MSSIHSFTFDLTNLAIFLSLSFFQCQLSLFASQIFFSKLSFDFSVTFSRKKKKKRIEIFFFGLSLWDEARLRLRLTTVEAEEKAAAHSARSAAVSLWSGTESSPTRTIVRFFTAVDLTRPDSTARACPGWRGRSRCSTSWCFLLCSSTQCRRWCCRARSRRCSGKEAIGEAGGWIEKGWGSVARWSSCRLGFREATVSIRCDRSRGLELGHRGSLLWVFFFLGSFFWFLNLSSCLHVWTLFCFYVISKSHLCESVN